jgi:phosphopantetheinyl transferase
MTRNAVAAGMTPYRPSPPPSLGGRGAGAPPTWPERTDRASPSDEDVWGTPSCADDLASWFGRAPRPPRPPAFGLSPSAALPLFAADGDAYDPQAEPAGGAAFLAERKPGGWTCVQERWGTDAHRALVLDRYLADRERDAYERLSPAVQPSWLLGRVAAKDAVRWWLADRGAEVAPADVPLANEPSGRPVIDPAAGSSTVAWPAIDLRISIAHVTGTGVAIVAQGLDVGIDVEEAAPRPASFARVAFSRHERAERAERAERTRLDERAACSLAPSDPHVTMDEATWMAAAWTAKEAVGKAAGTGLQGRPTRFVTRLVGPDLFAVGERLVRCHRLDPVTYCSHAGHSLVVGWTLSVDRGAPLVLDGAHA